MHEQQKQQKKQQEQQEEQKHQHDAELEQMRERLNERQDQRLCCICLDKLAICTFLPCGHTCVCSTCAKSFRDGSQLHCPICRTKLNGERVLRVRNVFSDDELKDEVIEELPPMANVAPAPEPMEVDVDVYVGTFEHRRDRSEFNNPIPTLVHTHSRRGRFGMRFLLSLEGVNERAWFSGSVLQDFANAVVVTYLEENGLVLR